MKIYYVDGSTRGKNQKGAENTGGFGVVQFYDEDENFIQWHKSEQCENTTNNREELKGLIAALEHCDYYYPDEKCTIYCDSAYVVNMFNEWIFSWSRNGWKNSKKVTVENLDLVLELWEFAQRGWPHYEVKKTDGHVGIIGNELADALATYSYIKFKRIIQEEGISIEEE